MPAALPVIAAVASIAGTVQGVMSAQEQKKLAKRQARIQEQQRALEIARQTAELARTARIKRASIANAAGQNGLQGSTIATGAIQGVTSDQAGKQSYLDQGLVLAQSADAITLRQINNDAQSAVYGSISHGLSAFDNPNSNASQGLDTISSWVKGLVK